MNCTVMIERVGHVVGGEGVVGVGWSSSAFRIHPPAVRPFFGWTEELMQGMTSIANPKYVGKRQQI